MTWATDIRPRSLATSVLDSEVEIGLRDLRSAGGLMLGAAALWPALPVHPGFACPLRTLTGIPCPLCGMTTSVVACVHLDLHAAVAANPAGPIAVLVALWLLWRRPATLRLPTILVVLGVLLTWSFELV